MSTVAENRFRVALEKIAEADKHACAAYNCAHSDNEDCAGPLQAEVERCADIAADALDDVPPTLKRKTT